MDHLPGGILYSNLSELDEIVESPWRLLEDFKVSIPFDAPSVDEFRDSLTVVTDKDLSDIVEFYAAIRAGEIPERLPADIRKNSGADRKAAMAGQFLHQYLQQAGCYSKITKYFARGLKEMIPRNSIVLDPMTGNGLLIKALREAGIASFGTDNNSWHNTQSFESIDAVASLKRYGSQITHLLISWAPYATDIDFRLLEEVRKNYENVQIIVIGEVNGCTGSDQFWNAAQIYDDLECYETIEHLYDRIYFIE
jgi:hypothetical protein